MKYIEFVITARNTEELEMIEGILLSFGITDSVINDPRDVAQLLEKKNSYDWDYVDASVEALLDSKPSVTIYQDLDALSAASAEKVLDELEKRIQIDFPECTFERKTVCDEEWKDKWKEYFKPAKITEHLVVKPTWETYEKKEGELVLEIDPGMAFGTGTHETTSLCLELLEEHIKPGDSVLDVGCGSGILAIAAGLLGAGDVLGVEIDPVAVAVGKENVERNGLTDRVRVMEGDLTKGVDFCADIVLANLMADLVKILSGDVARHMRPNGVYISSGILAELSEEVSQVIEACGFKILEVRQKGEWCAIAAVRPSSGKQESAEMQ